jgi:ATP-dependent RNA helicase RhlE
VWHACSTRTIPSSGIVIVGSGADAPMLWWDRAPASSPSSIAPSPSLSIGLPIVRPFEGQLMSFADLGLSPDLLRAVLALGLTEPTPIQETTVPAILSGRDLVGAAPTGSGKTLAYTMPLAQLLAALPSQYPRPVRALLLVPTRELALQVGEVFGNIVKHIDKQLKVLVAFGGVSINPQMQALRGGADVVVATPGRLLDLVEKNALKLDDVQILVLDEADRLLDLGFADELGQIRALLPARPQTLLFSATFPKDVEGLAKGLLVEPTRIEVPAVEALAATITQRSIVVDAPRRTQLLASLIRSEGWSRVLVFVATKHAADHVAEKLRRAGIGAESFHGELSQGKRNDVLAHFKAEHLTVLVATDVASRGIDIALLPVVVNYDLPRSATDYIHRIGRTGRAGAAGTAVSFVNAATEAHFRLIERRQAEPISLVREQIVGFEPDPELEVAGPVGAPAGVGAGAGVGGVKGRRPSKKDKLRQQAAATAAGDSGPDTVGGERSGGYE